MVTFHTVLLVCAQRLFREGLARLLRDSLAGEVYQFGAISDVFYQLSEKLDPDLMIVETPAETLAEPIELKTVRERLPGIKIVLLADQATRTDLRLAVQVDADGFLLKHMSIEVLNAYLHLISLGERPIPSVCMPLLADANRLGDRTAPAYYMPTSLSVREREILHGLVDGYPNKAIAQRLNITEATVKGYVKKVLTKTGAANRTQAAIWAFNHGFVPVRTGNGQLDGGEPVSSC